ncbi:hypothetical protein Ancab_022859 [Ancistrocladus abbreviatus]
MNNLFLGINALAYNVQQEPPTNDEVVLGNFEFLRTSRAKEFRKDNEEELFNSDVEVDDQRFKGHSHSANPDHPSQEWATSADFLGLSPEAQFQPNYSREVDEDEFPIQLTEEAPSARGREDWGPAKEILSIPLMQGAIPLPP